MCSLADVRRASEAPSRGGALLHITEEQCSSAALPAKRLAGGEESVSGRGSGLRGPQDGNQEAQPAEMEQGNC